MQRIFFIGVEIRLFASKVLKITMHYGIGICKKNSVHAYSAQNVESLDCIGGTLVGNHWPCTGTPFILLEFLTWVVLHSSNTTYLYRNTCNCCECVTSLHDHDQLGLEQVWIPVICTIQFTFVVLCNSHADS